MPDETRISYAAVLHEIATEREDWHNLDCDYARGESDVCVCPAGRPTHVLRSLAALVERLTNQLPPMPTGYALTATGVREYIQTALAIDIACELVAGFATPSVNPRLAPFEETMRVASPVGVTMQHPATDDRVRVTKVEP